MYLKISYTEQFNRYNCCGHTTMFSGQKTFEKRAAYSIVAMLAVTSPFRHRGLTVFLCLLVTKA